MTLRRLAALAALALGAALAPASPASAHALLLRTEPAPQTTVKTAPTAVRLFFSEPVEVTFGAIRVFDVNGKRVDPGTIHRVGDGSQVDVPLSGIKDGTYTVTWRAVSADGHAVSGGFTFYVGNPSPISAVAVQSDQGAGRLVGWGYGAVRFAWFAGLLGLIGALVVRPLVWTPAVRAAGLGDSEAAASFRRRFRPALLGSWVVLAVSSLLALLFQATTASGLSLFEAARPSIVGDVLHTTYGHLWTGQTVLTVLLLLPVLALLARRPLWGVPPRTWVVLALEMAVGLAALAGLNSHARTLHRTALAVGSVALHLLAVGVWVGGLAVLVAVGGPAWRALPAEGDGRRSLLRQLVPRFSRLAFAGVVVVLVTGTLNAILELATPGDLWRLTYGRAISAKIVLLGVALVLAARHRWVIPRKLAAGDAAAVGSFERTARWETVALGLTVAVTAGLVVLIPGRTVALAADGPVNVTARTGGYVVQLYIDPTHVGANQFHVSFVTPDGLAAGEVDQADVSLAAVGAAPGSLAMRLISPGHFVGDGTLPAPGRYQLSVNATAPAAKPSTTFNFRLRESKGATP